MATKKLTSANDTYSGTASDTVIYGYNGNDVISAVQTGTAVVNGVTVNIGATVYGGGGNDSLTGSTANDRLFGGDGADTISSGTGDDRVDGGTGNDTVSLGAGKDIALGNIGNDTLTGGAGMQTMNGGAGNDSIDSGTDASTSNKHNLLGGAGADTITASGSAGLNYIYSGADNDSITGSATGHDTINAGLGTNIISGGGTVTAGLAANHANELITYTTVTKGALDTTNPAYVSGTVLGGYVGVSVNLATTTSQTVAAGIADTITSVDSVTGSAFNDTLTGNLFANKVNGGLGHDLIDSGGTSAFGGAGSAQAGNDTLLGGYGNDTIVMHNGSATDDSIDGGVGTDTVSFANIFNSTSIAVGSTAGLIPSAPTGTYTSAAVDGVYVNLSSDIGVVGGTLSDNMLGNAGQGHITAVEKLIGSGFKDYIVSVGGATIDGGAGNDTIVAAQGGNGTDVLKGGGGTNVYDGTSASFKDYFGIGNATGEFDNIYGFNNGSASQGDKLYISASAYGNFGATATDAIGAAATGTLTSGVVASGTGIYTHNGVIDEHVNTAGKVTSYTLNSSAVVVQGAGTTLTAAATHAEFVYNSASGDLFYIGSAGAAAGSTLPSAIAHMDVNTFTSAHATGAVLDWTDFILVA